MHALDPSESRNSAAGHQALPVGSTTNLVASPTA
jgi:hypothetical protein